MQHSIDCASVESASVVLRAFPFQNSRCGLRSPLVHGWSQECDVVAVLFPHGSSRCSNRRRPQDRRQPFPPCVVCVVGVQCRHSLGQNLSPHVLHERTVHVNCIRVIEPHAPLVARVPVGLGAGVCRLGPATMRTVELEHVGVGIGWGDGSVGENDVDEVTAIGKEESLCGVDEDIDELFVGTRGGGEQTDNGTMVAPTLCESVGDGTP
mmetsp:Transcript_75869/g.178060  ORF Transcript_75869/g.178060 Transcript_75869/m.178060 type:complete len:209 (+) Transcript_75869:397-1023(+)